MNPNATLQRLARLQRECDLSPIPALLLFAACAVLVLTLGLGLDETAPAQAEEPTHQTMQPAT